MAFAKKSSSFHKILILVFGIAFGLVALAVGYQAMNNSADIRSRAAQQQAIYKQWEFTGADTEGWVSENPYVVKAQSGYLTLSVPKAVTLPAVTHREVNASIDPGLKTFSMSLMVGAPIVVVTSTPRVCPPIPRCATGVATRNTRVVKRGCPVYTCPPSSARMPVPVESGGGFGKYVKGATDETDQAIFQKTVGVCPMDVKQCSNGSYVGRIGPQCVFAPCPSPGPVPSGKPIETVFTGRLWYKLAGRDSFEKPVEFEGIVNGKFTEYKVTIPQPGKITIERLRIEFTSGIKPGDTVSVDWVRLLGPVVKPTPSTSPTTCKTGINYFSVNTPCTSGFRYAVFVCHDGYKGTLGGSTSCKSSDAWSSEAQYICAGRSNCPSPTTATGTPPIPTSVSRCSTIGNLPSCNTAGCVWFSCANNGKGACNAKGVTLEQMCPTPSPSCPPNNPISCPPPPYGCSYYGGTSCSCGTLICSTTSGYPVPTKYGTPTPTPTPPPPQF